MMTAAVLLMSLVATDTSDPPAGEARSDASSLRAGVRPVGRWCHERVRVQLSLKNVSQRPIWIALEPPSKEPIEWMHYSFFYDDLGGGGVGAGGVADGVDPLSFLRNGEGTRLEPGASARWLLQLDLERVRVGRVELTIEGPVEGTTDLTGSGITLYEFEAKVALAVRRAGRCFAARHAGPPADPG